MAQDYKTDLDSDMKKNGMTTAQLMQELSALKKRNIQLERLEIERSRMEKELKEKAHSLKERIKEINCLYGISKLVEKSELSLDQIYQGIVDLIPSSWQYPEITSVILKINGSEFKTANYNPTPWRQSADIIVYNTPSGALTVNYLENRGQPHEDPFLKEERSLLDAIAERLGRTTEHKQAEIALQKSERKLKEQNILLQDKNIALREVMQQLIFEKKALEEKMLTNVDRLLLPLLKKINTKGSRIDKEYLQLLEDNLKGMTSSFGSEISKAMHKLTPREIEICNLVRGGLSSKEIAGLLNITYRSVETYRNFIRKKLGLIHRKINLTTYLKTL